jgi:hydrogenase-4 component B
MTTAYGLLALAMACHAAGALGALSFRGTPGRACTAFGAMGGSIATLSLGLWCLATGARPAMNFPFLALSGLSIRVDALSAFFLVVIGVVGAAIGLYGFGYSASYEGRYSLRFLGSTLNLLLAALAVQVIADDALTFLILWEVVSLAAYALVLTEHDQVGAVRAANWYFAVTHVGFAALVAAFLLLSGGSVSLSFESLRSVTLSTGAQNAVFLLALFGFAAKAGIVPLHVWLPMAHPVAPTHVSALLSGVVVKMGVYGLLRVSLDLLGGGPAWWGGAILGLGAMSALLGVLYALMENDLKRLLAYSSVENVGIILIGVGAGLMFHSYGLQALAVLALAAGLYHTLNHACFKGLLFLGAGSVLHATHTRNMEELGGLIRRMPRTAFFFLVGAAAIAALPPLNGFASEWLIFQALLGGSAVPQPEVAVVMPIAVALLALTSGLAVAGFAKAFGITFLALPRSAKAEEAREAPRSMQLGMGFLALACVVLGLGPFLVVPMLGRVFEGLGTLPPVAARFSVEMPLVVSGGAGAMSPVMVAVGLAILGGATWIGLRLFAERRTRAGEIWRCGRIGQTARMEYTATAFAEPLRRVFVELYRPAENLSIDFHPESKYFVQSIEYRSEVRPLFERLLYAPLVSFMQGASRRVRLLQAGSLHLYLAYMAVALLVGMLAAKWL